ncbi:hypothetical protein OUZ56_017581 [Daphnia magna]|uniref:Uncharacterized protein n=1 Tax=Daphnia magna TaxID=35525 RepID=A0ABR0AT74_9CRUS|nr:hypothetical protein OUZ56_017581 [Daphnia magna]
MLAQKLPYGKTHVAIASTHRFNCPATMAIETLEATSKYKKPKSVSIAPTLPYKRGFGANKNNALRFAPY